MKEAYKIIDDFLSIEDLEMLSEYVDNNGSAQSRYKSKDIANYIYTNYVDKFIELDAYIQNVDFLIDIDKVVSAVQPETDKVLKGL